MEYTTKERAQLLAIRQGMSLYAHGRAVYGMKSDGTRIEVCRWRTLDDIWVNALRSLSKMEQEGKILPPSVPRFCLRTSMGYFEADGMFALLWKWLLGDATPAPTRTT